MTLRRPTTTIAPPSLESQRTYCVLGVPRGGTTMVAGLMARMGINMGTNRHPITEEDQDFVAHKGHRDLFDNPARDEERRTYLDSVAKLIVERNATLDVWGWKDPIANFYVRDVVALLRNPHFVYVTRDLGAVAQHEMYSEKVERPMTHLFAHMLGAAAATADICKFLVAHDSPCLLVSYERSLASPGELINGIAEFAGAAVDTSALEAFVKPIAWKVSG